MRSCHPVHSYPTCCQQYPRGMTQGPSTCPSSCLCCVVVCCAVRSVNCSNFRQNLRQIFAKFSPKFTQNFLKSSDDCLFNTKIPRRDTDLNYSSAKESSPQSATSTSFDGFPLPLPTASTFFTTSIPSNTYFGLLLQDEEEREGGA